MKDIKIEFAPGERIARLGPYVDRVLDALGHPEAFVSDESSIGDFFAGGDDTAEQLARLADVSKALGLTLAFDDYIADVAERLQGGH